MNLINSYACYNRNYNNRIKSSSGAVFSLLAEDVLMKKGVVYGVAMAEDCYSARFIEVTDVETLKYLRGSKYLQAIVGNTYSKVKENLQLGKLVLFSGTGCQVNGLKRFLGKDYDNLICVDVVCHGVPSPKLWRKYVKHQEGVYSGKMSSINFRCKDNCWSDFGVREIFMGNEEISHYISRESDSYMQFFLRDYSLRPSCYCCTAKKNKLSDLTVADFWGINEVLPDMNDEKGISLVLTRTKKGQEIFANVMSELEVREVAYADGVKKNPSEYESVYMPFQRKIFFRDMDRMSYKRLECKYLKSRICGKFFAICNKMTNAKPERNCSGCSACYAVCPKNAIVMVEDKEGFLYPQIDSSRCVGCGRCDEVCERKKVYAN